MQTRKGTGLYNYMLNLLKVWWVQESLLSILGQSSQFKDLWLSFHFQIFLLNKKLIPEHDLKLFSVLCLTHSGPFPHTSVCYSFGNLVLFLFNCYPITACFPKRTRQHLLTQYYDPKYVGHPFKNF